MSWRADLPCTVPERDFGVHSAVYRRENPEFFQTFLEYGSDLEGCCYCFWVTRDDRRVGGIIIRPNHIEGLFVIPPFADAHAILAAVKPLLLHWSDRERDIEAVELLPYEVDLYYRLGFRPDCIRRHLIRPTESFDLSWDSHLDVRVPRDEDLQELAELHFDSFSGGVKPWGDYDLATHVEKAQAYFRHGGIFREASTILYDTERRTLAGSCLVYPDEGLAKVGFLAVRPGYRRRGLAAGMIRAR